MRWVLTFLFLSGLLLAASQAVAAAEPKTVLAGWLGVFPQMPGYQRTFQAPVVSKDKKDVYQQGAEYLWTGGDIRKATATLARDPAFKTAHAAEKLTALGAKEIKVGKKTAWLLPAEKPGPRQPQKIIVPLGDDKALLVEGTGGTNPNFLTDLAAAFDPEKSAAALNQPPRTDFGRNIEAFRALKKDLSLADVIGWLGEPDKATAQGTRVLEYQLPDRSSVLVGFATTDKLGYVRHEKDGKTEELVK